MYLEQSRVEVSPGTIPAQASAAIPFRRFWHSDRAGLLGLLLVTLAASLLLFGGGVVIGQDSATQFYPWYSYLGERLSGFEIPGWNPYQFGGAPFAADPQSGWMYLPAMLLFTLFSIALAAPLFILFHLLLAGAGTYALSRLLGVGVGGALTAAAAYELTSPLYARSVCCPAQIEVGAWMPIALVGAEIAVRNRHWTWRVIGWTIGGLAVSQALGAWLGQGGYYFLLFLAAFIAYRALFTPVDPARRWRVRLAGGLVAGVPLLAIGFGLSAAGTLPRYAYVERSNVAGGDYGGESAWAASIGGITPAMAWDHLLDPTLYYPGAAALVLALAGIVLARGRFAAPFFAGLGFVALLLAMPWDSPLHRVMYALLPKFEQLHRHWPERVAIVSYLAVAMLAGAAVEALVRDRIRPRRFLLAFGPPVAGLIIIAIANADIPLVTLGAITVTLLLVNSISRSTVSPARFFLPALLVLTIAIDLLASFNSVRAEGPYGGFHRVNLGEFFAPTAATEFLRTRMEEAPGRFIGFDPELHVVENGQEVLYRYQFAESGALAILVNNRGVLYGIEDAQGYNPVQPRRFVDYLTSLNGAGQEYHDANVHPAGLASPLFNLLSIRYIVIPASYPADRHDLRELEAAFPVIYRDSDAVILENQAALPRAWLVHDVRRVATNEVLPLLASGDVDPRQTALVERAPPIVTPPAPGAVDQVTLHERRPELLRLTVEAGSAGLLVLSEPYDPGWRAYIDGERVDLLTANYLFQAVAVPAGRHTIELRYEPRELRIGLAISGLTALIVLPAFGLAIYRRRPYGSEGETDRRSI